jgi:hypothetical protein
MKSTTDCIDRAMATMPMKTTDPAPPTCTDYQKLGLQVDADDRVFSPLELPNVLTKEECDCLINKGTLRGLARSMTGGGSYGTTVSDARTSNEVNFSVKDRDEQVAAIITKIQKVAMQLSGVSDDKM